MSITNIKVPKPILEEFPDLKLTRNEIEAVCVLFDRREEDEDLRNAMTLIRGTKPEWIIKHYFRKHD